MSTYYFTKIYFLARGLTLPQSRDWKWNIMDCFNEGFPGGFPYYWHNAAVLKFLLFRRSRIPPIPGAEWHTLRF